MVDTRRYLYALVCLLIAVILASCSDGSKEADLEGTPSGGGKQAGADGQIADGAGAGVKQKAVARMQEAIQQYERIVDEGGWPGIPQSAAAEAGDSTEWMDELRQLLTITGDLSDSQAQSDSSVYSQALSQAVKRFQARHGLKPDGVLGSSTIDAMSTTAEERLEQLRANLDRLEALPDSMGQRFILVNIPEYRLRMYENGKPVQEMSVIVGEEYEDQQTPRFSDTLEYVIFRPYWNVPDRIAAEEIVPEARRDADYLEENGYQITSNWGPDADTLNVTAANLDEVEAGTLKIRQKPGADNALGLVKFMFPNQEAIYLHGTPEDHLFAEESRAFSHGCIRVERPVDLAAFVLQKNQGWTRSRIEQAMHQGDWQQVNLESTIPVHLVYVTAYVDDKGDIRFFEDVYHLVEKGAAIAQTFTE